MEPNVSNMCSTLSQSPMETKNTLFLLRTYIESTYYYYIFFSESLLALAFLVLYGSIVEVIVLSAVYYGYGTFQGNITYFI